MTVNQADSTGELIAGRDCRDGPEGGRGKPRYAVGVAASRPRQESEEQAAPERAKRNRPSQHAGAGLPVRSAVGAERDRFTQCLDEQSGGLQGAGVVAQRLVPTTEHHGQAVALDLLLEPPTFEVGTVEHEPLTVEPAGVGDRMSDGRHRSATRSKDPGRLTDRAVSVFLDA
ncbi:hypothetical protein GCM10014719_68320 [Planomonospora parontospora subsp. antibiotica]|nr:hypothetical protein GCM10014719_68320 [Planomonospora parontospora subsp. antibiotica]GII20032.1 hypothetical protein Ppa05_67580 [Planomonospora parontospora subsp. antibiotica]